MFLSGKMKNFTWSWKRDHFTDEKNEAQRGDKICLRSYSKLTAELKGEFNSFHSGLPSPLPSALPGIGFYSEHKEVPAKLDLPVLWLQDSPWPGLHKAFPRPHRQVFCCPGLHRPGVSSSCCVPGLAQES